MPLILAVLATLVKIYCFRYTGYSIPFLLYFMVILLSGIIAGSRGVLIALFAVTLCTFFWLIPVTDGVGRYTFSELALFLAEGIAISLLFYWIERSMRHLDESEKKYRRIIDQSAEALIMCDQDCQIIYTSLAGSRLLNSNSEELTGKKFQKLIHPDDQFNFEMTALRLQERGEGSALLRQRILCGNGEWRWTECCMNNLLKDKLVAAIVLQMRDINERMSQERHQEDFVNMASHELKAPISAIRGYLQIANKRWNDGNFENHQQYLIRIQTQTDKLLGLIDDMLNMTRIKAGELTCHFESISLVACLQDAVDAMKATAPHRTIEIDIQPNLPSVEADKGRIGQVVTNLLTNALKYSPENESVKVALYQKNEWLELTVIDRGIGIPKDKLQRVFDRFYRAESLPKGKFEGLGLGLFIAAEIVHMHHGHIWAESDEGKGSTFYVSLPLINT